MMSFLGAFHDRRDVVRSVIRSGGRRTGGTIDHVLQRVTPYLLYSDVAAALAYLERVFGCRETLRFIGPGGRVNHAEMRFPEGGEIMLGDPGAEYRNPTLLGGSTQSVHVYVDDVDAHFDKARQAGATIERELADQPYGDRTYAAVDPEGHRWFFATRVKEMAPEEWGAVSAPGADGE
jgi:PhnB protein